MSHGLTKIASKGACIYCGTSNTVLTDEHVIPSSLGGQHILLGASCRPCADLTDFLESLSHTGCPEDIANRGKPEHVCNTPSRLSYNGQDVEAGSLGAAGMASALLGR
jgi:hypothetical protein